MSLAVRSGYRTALRVPARRVHHQEQAATLVVVLSRVL